MNQPNMAGLMPEVNSASRGTAATPQMLPRKAHAAQTTIWVRATRPIPVTLPTMNCVGVMDASKTSMMRELFSSMTPRMMAVPQTRKVM